MNWLKRRWEIWKAWANRTPTRTWIAEKSKNSHELGAPDGLELFVWAWAFALAVGGAKAFNDGISFDAVLTFGTYLLMGYFLWALHAAALMISEMQTSNLRRLGWIVACMLFFTFVSVEAFR